MLAHEEKIPKKDNEYGAQIYIGKGVRRCKDMNEWKTLWCCHAWPTPPHSFLRDWVLFCQWQPPTKWHPQRNKSFSFFLLRKSNVYLHRMHKTNDVFVKIVHPGKLIIWKKTPNYTGIIYLFVLNLNHWRQLTTILKPSILFSCPEQLNRWPCHSLTNSLTH